MPYTVAQLKADVIQSFPRTDEVVVPAQVDLNFPKWVRALCRMHSWQFNTVRPGSVAGIFPLVVDDLTLPLYPGADRWIHRGWLLTEVGVDTYEFKAPYDDTDPELGFADALVREVVSVKLFNLEGAFQGEVPCHTSSYSLSQANRFGDDPSGRCMCWIETFPEISILRLHPPPTTEFCLAIEFVLGDAPTYTVASSQYNRVVSAAYDAVREYGLMHLAKHFLEDGLHALYKAELFGNNVQGPGEQRGIIRDMKEAERTENIARDTRWEQYTGAMAPYNGAYSGRRYRGWRRGFYYNP